jgi:peptidoglycan/xylan/chitin deacetylase (PgdA/CDA1 family)
MRTVSFIFDDGYQTEYNYALPLFEKYKAVACSAVSSKLVGKHKEVTKEPYSTKEQLLEMQSKGWEIISHGQTHKSLTYLPIYAAELEIKASRIDLMGMGFEVNNMVYPCHNYNDNVKFLTSQHYNCARGKHCVNKLEDKYALGGILIDDHTKLNLYKKYISDNSTWLIFYCHLCHSEIIPSTIQQRLETVEQLIKHCIAEGNQIKTMNGAYNEYFKKTS